MTVWMPVDWSPREGTFWYGSKLEGRLKGNVEIRKIVRNQR